MKKIKAFILPLLLLTSACGENQPSDVESIKEESSSASEEIKEIETTESSEESQSSEETETDEINTNTVKITFNNSGIKAGTGLIGDSNKANMNNLKTICNKQEEIVTSIVGSGYVGFINYGREKDSTLCIGSRSVTGLLTFNFAETIKKVSLKAQSYWKYVSYDDTYSMDLECELTINGYDNSLTATQDVEPEIKTFEYDDLNVNSLTIANNDINHRVLILELEVTYNIE